VQIASPVDLMLHHVQPVVPVQLQDEAQQLSSVVVFGMHAGAAAMHTNFHVGKWLCLRNSGHFTS
jgi:hypothetical protein